MPTIFQYCLPALFILVTSHLHSQPQPTDLFREYAWTPAASSEAGRFLRIGGRYDYRVNPANWPDSLHTDGHIPFAPAVDLAGATRAELMIEKVLSHEGTENLRVSVNKNQYRIIPIPAAVPAPQDEHYYHTRTLLAIPLSELTGSGPNTIGFEVDSIQNWGWPQNVVYGAVLRIYYDKQQKDYTPATVSVVADNKIIKSKTTLLLNSTDPARIKQVDYLGHYRDVDWKGHGVYTNWQYTYNRGELERHIGTATSAPYSVEWQTEWLPDQPDGLAIAARVHDENGLIYFTEAIEDLELLREHRVVLAEPYEYPDFWVTRGNAYGSAVDLAIDVRHATKAKLYWTSWSPCYHAGMDVNGTPLDLGETPCYDMYEHEVEVPVSALKAGRNEIRTAKTPLHDGQMVHGMEVQFPGPMLKVKYSPTPAEAVPTITEVTYLDRPHFRVTTPTATYYYDRRGGGLSGLMDPAGNDWIGYRREPWGEYPASAASAYRGIPNLVHWGDEAGAGHPGHDQCTTEQIAPNQVRTTSRSGKWQWSCTFYADHAQFNVEKVDTSLVYWFLYEGMPHGEYAPKRTYWATDASDGVRRDRPGFFEGESYFGNWQWLAVGHRKSPYTLFVANDRPDDLTDTYSYLGDTEKGVGSPDGMVVYGSGRNEKTEPLFTEAGRVFYVGLYSQAVRKKERLAELRAWLGELLGNK